MIARDQEGDLIGARAVFRQGEVDLILVEAIVIHEALSWVKHKE